MKRMISILLVLLMMLSSFSFADTVENQYGLEASLSKETYSSKESVELSGTISKDGTGFSYTPVFIKVWDGENSNQPKLTGEVFTDTSGNFHWEKSLTGLDDGKYTVNLESQVGLNQSLEFYIVSNKSEIELSESSYVQGEEVEISGTAYSDGELAPYASINIKVYLDGQEKFVDDLTADKDGEFSSTLNLSWDQELGDYIVQVDISGEEILVEEFTVEENPNKTMIEVDKSTYKQGEEVQISGIAYSKGEVQPYASVNIKVYLEGEEKFVDDLTADNNGEFNTVWSLALDQALGNYIVEAEILGETLEESFTVEEEANESTLVLDDDSYYIGETVMISGTAMLNDEAQADTEINITILYDGEVEHEESITTDSEGNYETTYELGWDQEIGDYTVEAEIFGTTLEEGFTVKENPNQSILELDESTYKQGEEVNISGVAYNNGEVQPYASVNIKVYLEGEEKFVDDIISDKNGEFSTTWSLASDQELGSYTVEAEILGATLEEEFTVEAKTNESTLVIDADSYYKGETVTIGGMAMLNSEAQADAEVSITILYDGEIEYEETIITDSDGNYETTYELSSDQELGDYTVQAEILGTILEEEFTVEEETNESTLVLDADSYYRGETVTIKGTAMLNSEAQADTEVNITILYDGEVEHEETITTDSEGNYETTYELSSDQELGDYTVQAEILGTIIEASFEVQSSGGGTNESTLELDKTSYKHGEDVYISGIAYSDGEIQPYASVIIKVFLEGEEKFVKDLTADKYGEFNTVFSLEDDQELGIYTVQVDISGEETLEKEFTVEEETNESTLELDADSYYRGETVTISGMAMLNNEAQADTEVNITILYGDEVEYEEAITTDSEGNYETTYELSLDQEIGNYTVQAEILDTILEEEFTVVEETNESTLVLDADSYYRGESVTISGIAMLNYEAQADTEVNITILYGDEVEHKETITTDSEGSYETTYVLSLDQELGDYTVRSEILGSTLEEEFTVVEETNESTLVLDDDSYYRGETVTISGTAVLNNEAQVETEVSITILYDGEIEHEETITTDSEGSYETTYELSLDQELGEYTVQAEILGTTLEEEFTVVEETNESTLVLDDDSYYRGETITISGTAMLNNEAQADTEVSITILYDGEVEREETITTDSEGNYETTYELSSSQELGDYTVQAEILGMTIEASFEVKKKSSGGGTGGTSSGSSDSTEKETEKIKPSGGKAELFDGEVVLDFAEGTFDSNVNVSVEVIDEDDITLPQSTSTTKLMIAGKIYEFDSEGATFNKSVSITLEYDKDKVTNPQKLGIYFYNEETKEWEYIGGKVDVESGTITVELQHFSKYAVMEFDKSFDDIDIPWAKEQIEVLASRHIIDGVSETSYAPNARISRAAFAKLLVNALNLETGDNVVSFDDIEDGMWYTEPVETAASLDIVKGYGNNFNPNGEITREAMAVMIVRALKQVDPDGDYTSSDLSFEDADSISDWAKDEVGIASDKGLITGVSEAEFAPKENATRAQAAVIIYRLLELLGRL